MFKITFMLEGTIMSVGATDLSVGGDKHEWRRDKHHVGGTNIMSEGYTSCRRGHRGDRYQCRKRQTSVSEGQISVSEGQVSVSEGQISVSEGQI
jgi:hypothetical protein